LSILSVPTAGFVKRQGRKAGLSSVRVMSDASFAVAAVKVSQR